MKVNEKNPRLGKQIANLLDCGLNIIRACIVSHDSTTSKLDILINQVFDSTIVGGITGISAYISGGEHVSVASALLGFLLTFLIKMKEYRKIQ